MAHRVFGVRHHGPGSARHLVAALATWKPDAVLVEGPPDADDLLGWAGDSRLRPPVAILVYVPDEPGRAVFYPFAAFSPEWQAIRWALANRVPVRFMDLAAGQLLSLGEESEPLAASDPLALLAATAGHSDPERWWEDVIEHRAADEDPFDAVAEAMVALREGEGPPTRRTELREAAMRRQLRAALRAGGRGVRSVARAGPARPGSCHGRHVAAARPSPREGDRHLGAVDQRAARIPQRLRRRRRLAGLVPPSLHGVRRCGHHLADRGRPPPAGRRHGRPTRLRGGRRAARRGARRPARASARRSRRGAGRGARGAHPRLRRAHRARR